MRGWCPHCYCELKVPREVAGLPMQCPYCGWSIAVPDLPPYKPLMFRAGRAVKRCGPWFRLPAAIALLAGHTMLFANWSQLVEIGPAAIPLWFAEALPGILLSFLLTPFTELYLHHLHKTVRQVDSVLLAMAAGLIIRVLFAIIG